MAFDNARFVVFGPRALSTTDFGLRCRQIAFYFKAKSIGLNLKSATMR